RFFTQRADVLRPTSKPRSQIQSLRENPRLKLEAWARARLGVSITPTITVPERLAPDSRGPSQCSGISHVNKRKPAPALGSAAALVSAWLPKRTRIESIATSSFCACIFHGASEKDAGEKWRQPRLYRTLVRESRGSPAFLICLTGVALAAGFIPAATMSLK